MYIFCCLTYKNWQRPGVAINLTLEEAGKARRVDEKFVIHCRQHKTASTYGPAVLVLDDEDAKYFKCYIDVVRSTIQGGRDSSELALLTYNGRPLTHYQDLLASLTSRLGIKPLPNITAIRKAGATTAVQQSSKEGMEVISGHMCHSTSTSERYY